MKLHQLRYLVAVVESDLNITSAADRVHTSQPGISKQLRLMEEELGFRLFMRQGRALTQITPAGEQVFKRSQRILQEIRSIRRLSEDLRNENGGTLAIGTTHTQARYVLPPVIQNFRSRYPDVRLHLHQGTSEQIATMLEADQIDFAIATGSEALFRDATILPAYHWHRTLVVPRNHPMAGECAPTLRQLADHPIITYTFSFNGPSSLNEIFAASGLEPNVALTARDADVIKTYVRLGLGVGIVAHMAIDPEADDDLVAIDAAHLFPRHTTWVGYRRGTLLRRYMYDFLQLLAPHLDRRRVDRASEQTDYESTAKLFEDVKLPVR
ncbi:MAG: HTH-type transcriptional regulator CysB [Steroidobacteraceae bacterium]